MRRLAAIRFARLIEYSMCFSVRSRPKLQQLATGSRQKKADKSGEKQAQRREKSKNQSRVVDEIEYSMSLEVINP